MIKKMLQSFELPNRLQARILFQLLCVWSAVQLVLIQTSLPILPGQQGQNWPVLGFFHYEKWLEFLGYHGVFWAHFFLLVLAFCRPNIVMRCLVYILSASLHRHMNAIADAGDALVDIFLLLLVFSPMISDSPLRRLLANTVWALLVFQLVFVYAMAGLGKIRSDLWLHGEAIYHVFLDPAMSFPLQMEFAKQMPALTVAMTYFVIIFQLVFPMGVFVERLRPFLLFAGTGLHLGIAFGMGLVTFGFAMSVSYVLFYADAKALVLSKFMPAVEPLYVGFLEHCGWCQKARAIVSFLNWFQLIRPDGASSPRFECLANIAQAARVSKMCAIASTGEVYQGSAAVLEILRRIPLLFPILSLYWLLHVACGEKMYSCFSRRAMLCKLSAQGSAQRSIE